MSRSPPVDVFCRLSWLGRSGEYADGFCCKLIIPGAGAWCAYGCCQAMWVHALCCCRKFDLCNSQMSHPGLHATFIPES